MEISGTVPYSSPSPIYVHIVGKPHVMLRHEQIYRYPSMKNKENYINMNCENGSGNSVPTQPWQLPAATNVCKTRGSNYSLELLMMNGVSLGTCWAIKNQWNNKFYYTVASCWLFLYESCVGQQYETDYVFCFPVNTFIFLSLCAAKLFKTKYISWYLL
jgi:hypothetical protein